MVELPITDFRDNGSGVSLRVDLISFDLVTVKGKGHSQVQGYPSKVLLLRKVIRVSQVANFLYIFLQLKTS